MKKLLPIIALALLCSCTESRNVDKCKRVDIIYNYLISRELQNPKGIDLFKIDSLSKERERKIKFYSKI